MRLWIAAIVLPLLSAASMCAFEQCGVQGHIVNALTGEPVRKADVRIWSLADKPDESDYTSSANDGSFRFGSLKPGQYRIYAEKPGFVAVTSGFQAPVESQLATVTLNSGSRAPDVTLRLFPQAVVTGRVVDADGDGVPGVDVQLLQQGWINGQRDLPIVGEATSEDDGSFRVSGIARGRYYLAARQPPDQARLSSVLPLMTFYPGTTSPAEAAPLRIAAGQRISGIEIQLQTGTPHHVRGVVPPGLPRVPALEVTHRDVSTGYSAENDLPLAVSADGSFDLPGFLPGRYSLRLTSDSPTFAFADIEVTDADLDGVQFNVARPLTVHGRIVVQGVPIPDISHSSVSLQAAFSGDLHSARQIEKDGSFSIEAMLPGSYQLEFPSLPDGLYVQTARFGMQDVWNGQLQLAPGASDSLRIVLGRTSARISGKVAASPASVFLIPEVIREQQLYSLADPDGSYAISNIPPGRYQAIALSGTNWVQLHQPGVLKALALRGAPVEFEQPDETKQLDLIVLPVADLQQILTSLDIDLE